MDIQRPSFWHAIGDNLFGFTVRLITGTTALLLALGAEYLLSWMALILIPAAPGSDEVHQALRLVDRIWLGAIVIGMITHIALTLYHYSRLLFDVDDGRRSGH